MSGKKTVHYMHFMNWTNQVPGTFIGDHDPSQVKKILHGTLKQCTKMHDWMMMSGDKTYKSMWSENYVFASLLNPSQMALCNEFKEEFLKFLFGDLESFFKMNMLFVSFSIFYNSTYHYEWSIHLIR